MKTQSRTRHMHTCKHMDIIHLCCSVSAFPNGTCNKCERCSKRCSTLTYSCKPIRSPADPSARARRAACKEKPFGGPLNSHQPSFMSQLPRKSFGDTSTRADQRACRDRDRDRERAMLTASGSSLSEHGSSGPTGTVSEHGASGGVRLSLGCKEMSKSSIPSHGSSCVSPTASGVAKRVCSSINWYKRNK